MSCRRAFEIDLVAFLEAPRDPTHEAFRRHYPTCAECAAEVRAWSELTAALAPPGPTAAVHPAPAALAALAGTAPALAPEARAAALAHVAGCASCRDELATLRALGAQPFAGEAPKRADTLSGSRTRDSHAGAGRERSATGRGARAAGVLAALRRLVSSPVFATAVLLAVALPLGWRALRPGPPPATVIAQASRAQVPPPARARAAADDTAAEAPAARGAARSEGAAREGAVAARSVPPAPQAAKATRHARAESVAEPEALRAEADVVGAPGAAAPAHAAPEVAAEAAPALRRDARAAPEPAPLTLRRGAPVVIPAERARAGLLLRVPLLDALEGADARALRVRIASADGGRRLEEPARPGTDPATVELPVPPAWLATGAYRVTLVDAGTGEARGEDFLVRVAPGASP